MEKVIKYVIFRTKWGHFGLVGTECELLRACMPLSQREQVRFHLLRNLHPARYDKNFFKTVQEQIIAYFDGQCINFSKDIPVTLYVDFFTKEVLDRCRDIRFGQTISYLGLAKKLGRPIAFRAVGAALAKNPVPLIIPCHRVIRSDGKVGGFSGPGGSKLKAKLLKHERYQPQ